MEAIELLRELLPAEIVDNFDLVRYQKTKEAFDIWFDEKKIQDEKDATNGNIVAYGFGEYKEHPRLSPAREIHASAPAQTQVVG